jgi:Uma2 family endonuclease
MVATLTDTATRITPEEYLAMDEDDARGFELVDGQLEVRAVSLESSRIGGEFHGHLWMHVRAKRLGRTYGSDLSYRCFVDDPGRFRRADASYLSYASVPRTEYVDAGVCPWAPDLVAEVVSPNDITNKVERKIHEWLDAGVQVVVKIMPQTRTVHVCRSVGDVQRFRDGDDLIIEDLLPGFRVGVRELLDEAAEA